MKKLLVIGSVWPEPNSSAAGSRMMQLLHFFQSQRYDITFACTAQESGFSVDLAKYNIKAINILLNDASFDELIKKLAPQIVMFDRFMVEEQFGWRVAECCPNAIRILDTEDLHCLRKARQKKWKSNEIFVPSDLLTEEVAKREIASILRCDLSFIISEYEMKLLQEVFKVDSDLLMYLPMMVNPMAEDQLKDLPSFQERKDFVFIGNFLHEPNWNAVLYLKETIWPLVSKIIPDAKLKIYGAYPSQKVLQLHQPASRFLIMGRAENAQEVVSTARVVLAPLRFGAGIKGKLLEAMQMGTPSVTTTIGSESMQGYLPWNGFVSNEVEELVQMATQLYSEENLWKQAQKNGVILINDRFSKEKFETLLKDNLAFLISNRKAHREKNFLGALLQHHTLASTKYMSKWIEAKNK